MKRKMSKEAKQINLINKELEHRISAREKLNGVCGREVHGSWDTRYISGYINYVNYYKFNFKAFHDGI